MDNSYIVNVRNYYSRDIMLNDKAHDLNHCDAVYERMLKINKALRLEVDTKLIVLAAYLHDLKCHIDRKKHHILSVKYILLNSDIDPFLKELEPIELNLLIEAISSHRASVNNVHLNSLSELLYTADKDVPDLVGIILRSLAYTNYNIADTYNHIKEKFSRHGYMEYNDMYLRYYHEDNINKLYIAIDNLTMTDVIEIANTHKK